MSYLCICSSVLDSEKFLGAEPANRATWLMLARYAARQTTSGRIPGAKTWSDRKWQRVCRVTLRDVQRQCELWNYDGDDLQIVFCPAVDSDLSPPDE